jgi:hypothetical protein
MLLAQFLLCLCNQQPRGSILQNDEAWQNKPKLNISRPRPRPCQSVWSFRHGAKREEMSGIICAMFHDRRSFECCPKQLNIHH